MEIFCTNHYFGKIIFVRCRQCLTCTVVFNIFRVNKKHPNRSYTLWMSTTHSKNSIFCQHYNDNIPSALQC